MTEYRIGQAAAPRPCRNIPRARRASSCFRQAVLVLRWFPDAPRVGQLAYDAGISLATSYRYLHEGITVLADTAPELHEGLAQAQQQGLSHVIWMTR